MRRALFRDMHSTHKSSLVILVAALLSTASASAQPGAAKPSLLTPPASWSAYNSGGPLRAGNPVTLPDGRRGVVVGDFRTVPNGTASASNPGRYRYAVMVPALPPADATKDCPDFGLSVVTVEMNGNTMHVSGGASADAMIAEYKKRLGDYRARVLSAHRDGLAIQAKADKMLAKWNARNDRSRKKFSTAEGYTSLAFDMALAGMADKVKKGLKTTGDLDRIFKEALIDAAKEKLSGDLPLNAPGASANTAAAAELTKGNIKALIAEKMKDPKIAALPDNTRAEILSKVLVQFGALAIEGDGSGEELAEAAFGAAADVAVDIGLSRYPIAGPLAKEALELTKQLRGYLVTLDTLAEADASFTQALNAFNDSYGARQGLELMQKHRKALLKAASDALYKEDPGLEAWLVERVADRMEGRERAMKEFLATLPPRDGAMGPQAPGGTKKPLVLVDPAETAALDTFLMPGYIERAGQEEALGAFDGLRMDRPRYPSGRGGRMRFDVDRAPRNPQNPLDGLREIFRGPSPFGRGLTLELLPPEPPMPSRDEKAVLERDCRLKRMAQAERDIPRIGPQVRRTLSLRSMIGELPALHETGGSNVPRLYDTTPRVWVLPDYKAKRAAGAGIYRD